MKLNFNFQDDLSIFEKEIERFKCSERRRAMLCGEDYYSGRHDILHRSRTVIGENGELERAVNLPDNKAVDNQYRKLVNQKTNYLLGKPITFRKIADGNENFAGFSKLISSLFDKSFMRLAKNLCKDSYNHGIAWIYPFFDKGELKFKQLKGYELVPLWHDFEHTKLEYAVRFYETIDCSDSEKIVERAEIFNLDGIHYFELNESGKLLPVSPYFTPYITHGDAQLCWGRIPLIPFKRDSDESPLVRCVKSLQDGLNLILSNFWNAMEDDPRNTLLVLVNYDGADLGEFRRNLSAYGAVKVRSIDGVVGDVKTLRVEVNADNYRTIIDIFRRAIVENGMGFDAKDARILGNSNQMNIQSMYSDIDLDANEIETEFQASLCELMWFVKQYARAAKTPVPDEAIDFIFNRDMLLNESSVIDNCVKSLAILSRESVIANHPWVDDVVGESEKVSEEFAQSNNLGTQARTSMLK
ncbi:MAG: phage portal protein [Oscillospiraceae bacterium]|nr:phage portal protein [Oscillospiraceae bacterium]